MRKLQADQHAKEEVQRREHQAVLERMELRASTLQETIASHNAKKLDEQQSAHARALQGLQTEASKLRLELAAMHKQVEHVRETEQLLKQVALQPACRLVYFFLGGCCGLRASVYTAAARLRALMRCSRPFANALGARQ